MATVKANLNKMVAGLPQVQAKVAEGAAAVLAAASASASTRHRTGEFSSSFRSGKVGRFDREVYTEHPAAVALEFGHFAEKRDGTLGKWVPGQFNLVGAAKGVHL
jgi:hypothetical protein